MVNNFSDIVDSIEDSQLRARFNYFMVQALTRKQLEEDLKTKKPKKAQLNKKDKKKAIDALIKENPEFIDYFINYKEEDGDAALEISSTGISNLINESADIPKNKVLRFLQEFFKENRLTKSNAVSYTEALEAVLHMKDCVENKGIHDIFYDKQKNMRCNEEFFQHIFKLTTASLLSDVNAEVNNGRGPADFVFSNGANDKTVVEFKLASNSHLKDNLQEQVKIYKKASNAQHHIHVIFLFTEAERNKIMRILEDIGLSPDDENLVIIDARYDNKPSGSKAKAVRTD